jgi:fibronectin-binding autotransporter adhesin
LAVFLFSMTVCTALNAATYTVTSTADDGSTGTLRWAIGQANSNAGSTIAMNDNLGTITLTSALQIIETGMTIQGGTGNTISGDGKYRVFFVNTANSTDAVAINNVTIANGAAKGGDGGVSGGGGLGAGGAIFVSKGAVTVAGLTLSGNTAQGGNGGSGVALNSSVSAGGGGGLGGNGGNGGRFGAGGGGGYGGNGGAGDQNSSGGGGGIVGNGGNGSSNRGGGGGGTTDGGTPAGGIGGGNGGQSSGPSPTNGSTGGGGGGGTFDFSFSVNSGGNGGTYGGGGGASAGKDANSGRAGDGGEFGGGGGMNGDGGGAGGGRGGFGGGGGGGSAFFGPDGSSASNGADGGFGGGGGGGILDDGISAGYGGRGGSYGVRYFAFVPGAPGGGGGAALGGSIFVRSDNGASLTFTNGSEVASSVTAGLAGVSLAGNSEASLRPAHDGQAVGGAIFLPTGNSVFQSGTFSGEVSGVSGAVLEKTTAGTVTLNGGGTGDLGLALEAGTLTLGHAGALGSRGTIALFGGTLQFSAANAVDYSARISGADNQQFNFDTNGQEVRLANSLVSSGGSLTKTGSGTLILGGMIGYSGQTTIASGTLRLEMSDADSGIFNLSGNGAALDLNGTTQRPVSLTGITGTAVYLGGGSLTLGGDNGSSTLALDISDAGGNSQLTGGSLTKLGAGTLTLTGNNSFTGNTTVSSGILQIGNGGTTGAFAGVIVNNSQVVFNRSDDVTFVSNISGFGTLVKMGAGQLTLNGLNSYTGSTDIQAGSLFVNGSLATPSVTMAAGTNFTTTGSGTMAVDLQGAGSFNRVGDGITIFTGTAGQTGGTTINGGTLQIGNGGSIGSIAGAITNNGTLAFNRSDFVTVAGSISGTGTLRQDGPGTTDLTGTNSYGNTVLTAGTLSIGSNSALGSGLITITGGTIRAGGSPRNLTNELALNGSFTLGRLTNFSGNAALGADITITSANPDGSGPTSSIFSGVISGGHSLTFDTGANPIGTIVLSGPNTYTGGTTLSAGTLMVGNASALGTGGLTINGGTLDLNSNALTVTGLTGSTGIITNSTGAAATLTTQQVVSTAFAGVFQNGSGTVGLTKTGPGMLTLLGNNTSTGATTITSGTLQIGNGGTVGSVAFASFDNTGSLLFNRSDAISYGGVITGTGSLTQLGQGILTLSGNSTYTGDTVLAAGTLSLGNAGALGNSGGIDFAGGILQFSSNNTNDYSARFINAANQAYRIDTNGETITFASGLTNSGGSLTKLGLGTLILAGNNSYDGNTVVEAGALRFTNSTVIRDLTLNGGSLDLAGRNQTITEFRGSSSALITSSTAGSAIFTTTQDASTTYAGVLEDGLGTLTFRKNGSGTLTLSGNNSYTGGTLLENGVLALGSVNAIGTAGPISFTGGTLQFSSNNTSDYSARFSNADGQSIRLDTNGQTVTLASSLGSEGGSLTKLGAGTLTLSGNNTQNGGTLISAGTLQIGSGGTTGTVGNGAIINEGLLAFNRSDVVVLTSVVTGSGALEQRGSGNLIVTSENTYTGDTRVLQGSLQIGNGSTTGSITSNVITDATLAFNRSDDVTFAASVSGLGTLEQRSASTLTLTGQNVNSGGAIVSAGTLQIGNGGSTGSISGNVTNAGVLAFNRNDTLTFAGGISGSGTLEQRGSGTLILTGASTYSGNTTIHQGTLQIGAGGTGGSITGDIVDNGSLVFNSSLNQSFAGAISGSGSVTKTGSNTLTLTGTNSYTGGVNIQAGTLAIANTSPLGASESTLAFGGQSSTGTLQALASLDLAQNISVLRQRSGRIDTNGFDVSIASFNVAGSLTKLGLGQLTLTGEGTLSGSLSSANPIRIASGATLRQINDPDFGSIGILSSDLIVDGSLVFDRSTIRAFDRTLSGSGTVTQVRSNLVLTGANAGFTGNIVLQGGTFEVGSDTALGSGGLTISGGSIRAGGAPRTITNPLTITGDFGLGRYTDFTSDIALTSDRTIVMTNPDGGGGDSFLRGTISGTGNFMVSGGGNAGVLGLSGTNTYTGDTIVTNGGTLAISSQANLGAVANTLVFQNGTLRLDGDLSLADRAIRLDGNFTLDTNGRDTSLSLANALGDGSFTKAGGGSLTLTGAASYTGGTSIDGGALIFSDRANLGTGGISLNNSATLLYAANNTADISSQLTLSSGVIHTNGNDLNFANTIGGTNYTLQKAGAGTLNLSGSTASMTRLAINAGILRLSNNGSALNAYTTVADGAALEINRSDTVFISRVVQATSGATLRFMGTGITNLSLSQAASYIIGADVRVDAGRLVLIAQNSTEPTRFESDITNNGVVEMRYSGTSTFANVISGIGGFVKSGTVSGSSFPAHLTLSGENTYTGGTTVNSGTLQLGNSGAVLADTGAVTVNIGTFRLGAANETIGSLAGSGGTVDLFNGAGRTLTIGGSASGNFAGTVSGNGGSLTKSGTGTLTLSGTNTYSGATNVTDGTLVVGNGTSGSLASGSVVTVSSGAVLAGNGGTINGATTIAGGGHLAPGDGSAKSIGTTTFNGTLAFTDTSIFDWDIASPVTNQADTNQGSYDKVIHNNATSMSGTSVFNVILGTGKSFNDPFWKTDKNWTDIFGGTGMANVNLNDIFTRFTYEGNALTNGLVPGQGVFSFNTTGTALNWTAVPEPTSALAGLLLAAGLLRRRRN